MKCDLQFVMDVRREIRDMKQREVSFLAFCLYKCEILKFPLHYQCQISSLGEHIKYCPMDNNTNVQAIFVSCLFHWPCGGVPNFRRRG